MFGTSVSVSEQKESVMNKTKGLIKCKAPLYVLSI